MNHLFLINTEEIAASEEQWGKYLSKERKEQAKKQRVPSAYKACVGTGILLQLVLEQAGHMTIPVAICREEEGKPYLKDRDVAFNISHSGCYGACGICDEPGQMLGVDIQEQVRIKEAVLSRMHPKEQERINALPKALRLEVLIRLWTQKESFVKAIGTGLSTSFADYCIVPIEKNEKWETWTVEQSLRTQKFYGITFLEKKIPYEISMCSTDPEFSKDIETIVKKESQEYVRTIFQN